MRNTIALIIKGACMGVAEAIPGVSGGTIAFITGIYQELIETIKSITPTNLKLLFSDFGAFWKAINGQFLTTLLSGMAVGIVFGVLVITHFLETEKEILWGFFFGLVLASAFLLGRDVSWNFKHVILGLIGAIISYFITTISPAEGSENLIYIFFVGSIVVSALMLPGVSGSFILLLFGLYHTVMGALKSVFKFDFGSGELLMIGAMIAGVLVGLFSFARLLSYMFKNYEQSTMALLIGVLLGSLNKLWPWKLIDTAYDRVNDTLVTINSTVLPELETFKIVSELNLLPSNYSLYNDPKTAMVVGAMIAGIIIIGAMGYFDRASD